MIIKTKAGSPATLAFKRNSAIESMKNNTQINRISHKRSSQQLPLAFETPITDNTILARNAANLNGFASTSGLFSHSAQKSGQRLS